MVNRQRAFQSLAEYLEKTHTRQEDFAVRVGVSPAYISLIVGSHRRPSLELAIRISEVANIPIESLIPASRQCQSEVA